MKIYSISKKRERKAQRDIMPAAVSGLKRAAGGEDILILTDEAINSFKKENSAKNRERELRELALAHINDYSPDLEGLENDPEFMKAEKLVHLAELVIRVSPSVKRGNVYGRITDFVVEQLTVRK
ncbi:MAG TPA: hypothetical protein PK358_10630 [Spirochaetota bacterium]|nr:hypothetical protein [Spirochaetota bacterium]HPJ35282.1 hypothetical protein [Spirochaetota bacterium]